ncbi:NACHT domain-containing NTPase [Nostocaceae cyanobacterium CENA369]|uniref:NACHT domain-containing NTPase n=2 Tax=Dendronalium TaxID=2840442 RepID=A0A8J7I764_9NOST|nr:NACHT domain-containing NTPase [Dendronalium phyllosphericum CENA369]
MAKRSLQASEEGIRKAKQAFKRKGWTQEYLAAEVSLETRQPIWKFFTGKPVDRHVFNDICFVLELDPSEIIQKPIIHESTSFDIPADSTLNIHALVKKLRSVYHEKIQAQCGNLHLLDIARPINLNDMYVDVKIFEELTSKRWLEILDLYKLEANEFKQLGLSHPLPERVSGLEVIRKYSKLVLLGKPGCGKTTFLQSIAISCDRGVILPEYLPIFVSLKNFAEDIQGRNQISFFNYLHDNLINFGVSEQELVTLFYHGKALILLDGLDEVILEDSVKIINIIRKFSEKYYNNHLIITSRIGVQQYSFPGFHEVEISDFTKQEIAEFAEKWFLAIARNSPAKAQILAHKFMQKLELQENLQILELVTTPLLLNLICLVFKLIEDFPANRSELYKQALDLLLVRWDEAKGIKRGRCRNLSLLDKIKLLSHIAAVSLSQGDYLLPETKMRQIIADYLRYLPDATADADALELESAAVLKAIAVQHGLLIERARGIYAFSHLVFQEYFAARGIITNTNTQELQEFVNHLGKKHWQNAFLLSAEMLKPADTLLHLIKQEIVRLATSNAKLHNFLIWLGHKSSLVNTFYHLASVRAFYFTIALPPEHPLACNQDFAIRLDRRLALNLAVDLGLDLGLIHALTVSLAITADIFFQRLSALSLALDLKHLLTDKQSLQKSLQDLKNQLPLSSQGREALKIWWQTNGKAWTEELRALTISTRQIGHDWKFNEQDLQQLQSYWDANKLLLDCLNSASNVTPHVRDAIKENLFLVDS